VFRLIVITCSVAALGLGMAPVASAYEPGPVYRNCTEAHNAGVYNIPKGDPAYWPDGDRDGDGFACEPKPSN
jgi:Excalibur calcium-binding domain